MKSFSPLALQGDRAFIVLGTGHHVRYFPERQVQQRKEAYLDLSLSSNGRNRRPVAEIHKTNDTQSLMLDPGKKLTGGVGAFHVEQHEGLGREAGHVGIDKSDTFAITSAALRDASWISTAAASPRWLITASVLLLLSHDSLASIDIQAAARSRHRS